MNPEKYLSNFNCDEIYKQILAKHNISSMEENYNRHLNELKKKFQSLIPTLKKKPYFDEMPSFNEELLLDVIILNTPFVPVEKRANFRLFLEKKTFASFKTLIKEYIFPYQDSDKDNLNNNGILIIKIDNIEHSYKIAQALNGTEVVKGRKLIALTYPEFEKISKMPENFEEHLNEIKQVENWEKNNFEEMMFIESKDRITVGKIHFLKKTFEKKYELKNNKDINEVKWSPQGKYLVISKDDQIVFYTGESDKPINELNIHSHYYNISNDENYIVTFNGYKNNSFKNEEKKEEKKDDKKDDKKEEKKEEKKDDKKEEKTDEKKDDKKEKPSSPENVFIRDIITDRIIRSFNIEKEEKFSNFLWSPDSKYLGRIKEEKLIIYELPTMKMIKDKQGNRVPIKDNVTNFAWFPNNNIIISITEKYDNNKKKLLNSTMDFIEIPSRNTYPRSSIANGNIIDLVWHKNNHILAILSKDFHQSKYSVRLIDFNMKEKTYISSNIKLPEGTKEKPLIDMKIAWMEDTLFIIPTLKESNVKSISVFPYDLKKKNLELEQWPLENCLVNLKHSDFIPSSNGITFILSCMDKNNTNNYGKSDLYVIHKNKMSHCRALDFGSSLSHITWDKDGRLCIVEQNTGKEKEGFKIINSVGDEVYEEKDTKLSKVEWRPRHKKIIEEYQEEKNIENEFDKISKIYEEEDYEFLSVHDKKKKAEDKAIFDKFTSIMKKRAEKFNNDKDRKEEKVENKISHDFWIEEIKSVNEVVKGGDDF